MPVRELGHRLLLLSMDHHAVENLAVFVNGFDSETLGVERRAHEVVTRKELSTGFIAMKYGIDAPPAAARNYPMQTLDRGKTLKIVIVPVENNLDPVFPGNW